MRVAIVHYHLGLGGVTRVIQSTSQELKAAGISHVVLASGDAPPELPFCPIAGLGYLGPPEEMTAEILLGTMRCAAADALGGQPDVWHFHNHSLGKNHLIAEVVALLADAGEAIVLQIHDLAENGRPQNYPVITGCQRLYPFSARIRYVFLNSRDLGIFTQVGLPDVNAELLPNPVSFPTEVARNDSSQAIVFAPVRGIRRKNLGELVLLAALSPLGTHFAISRAPQNAVSLPVHDNWRKFTVKHRLPITFDVVDHFTPAPDASANFDSWIRHATHFVSTSVEEGFGLTFMEAIAHSKPLFGRNLPHITREHIRHGIRSGQLYDRISIPLDWIDLTILEEHLTITLERSHRLYGRSLSSFQIAETLKWLVDDRMVDFGNLPEPLQQGAIERLSEKANRRVPLVQTGEILQPLEDWLAATIANRIPAAKPDQLLAYSPETYGKHLIALYGKITLQPAGSVRHLPTDEILTAHLAPENFHFLLSALEPIPAPVKFRAVIFDIYGTLLIAPSGGVKPDPLTDPLLREILRNAGHEPPKSPSTALYDAVLRHHATAAVAFPEIDLRTLWREILSLEPGSEVNELVEELETAWHPARLMPGAEKLVGKLARNFISLGLLSNAQSNTLASLGGMADLFAPELTILSYQHGVAKPAPELFQLLRDRLEGRKIAANETLYIGNDPLHDIVPAAAAGFRTALFTGHPDSLRPGECEPDHVLTSWADLNALF